MPMYESMNNTATLKVTNELLLTTRPLMRNCFGEYFFRSVVLQYFQGPVLEDVIVSLAVQLEASEFNHVDVDTVFHAQAVGVGIIGNYQLSEDSYYVSEFDYVPEDYLKFLTSKQRVTQRILVAPSFMK